MIKIDFTDSTQLLSPSFYEKRIRLSQFQSGDTPHSTLAWMTRSGQAILQADRVPNDSKDPILGLTIANRPTKLLGYTDSLDRDSWREQILFFQTLAAEHSERIRPLLSSRRSKNLFIGNCARINARFIKSLTQHELKNSHVLEDLKIALQLSSTASLGDVESSALFLLNNQNQTRSGCNWKTVLQTMSNVTGNRISLIDLAEVRSLIPPDTIFLEGEEKACRAPVALDPLLLQGKVDFSLQKPIYDPQFEEIRLVTPSEYADFEIESHWTEGEGRYKVWNASESKQKIFSAIQKLASDKPSLLRELSNGDKDTDSCLCLANLCLNLLDLIKIGPSTPSQDSLLQELYTTLLDMAERSAHTAKTDVSFPLKQFVSLLEELQTKLTEETPSYSTLSARSSAICDRAITYKLENLFSERLTGLRKTLVAELSSGISNEEYLALKSRVFSDEGSLIEQVILDHPDVKLQAIINAYLAKDGTRLKTTEDFRRKAHDEISALFQEWEEQRAAEACRPHLRTLIDHLNAETGTKLPSTKQRFLLLDFNHIGSSIEHLTTISTKLSSLRDRDETSAYIKKESVEVLKRSFEGIYAALLDGIVPQIGSSLKEAVDNIASLEAFSQKLSIEPRDKERVLSAFRALPEIVRNQYLCYEVWKAHDSQDGGDCLFGQHKIEENPYLFLGFVSESGQNLLQRIIERKTNDLFYGFCRNLVTNRASLLEHMQKILSTAVQGSISIRMNPAYTTELEGLGLNTTTQDPLAIAFQIIADRISMPLEKILKALAKDGETHAAEAKVEECPLISGLLETYFQLKCLANRADLVA